MFAKSTIGPDAVTPPWITNVRIADLDGDGRSDVLACDARLNTVWWYRQTPAGSWEEHRLGEDLVAPAHATVVDLDGDGRNDVLVAELGSIWPEDGVIGRVILLKNVTEAAGKGTPRFEKRVVLDDVRRVSDVQAGDLNGDGRIDLVVAAFGYDRGEVLWLENMGDLKFRDHSLHSAPGAIHVPLADFNRDGRTDIVTIVSQDEEELWGFENVGEGKFQSRKLWSTPNFDLGSAGLVADDLDQDGLIDLVLPVGDNLEDINSYPQPYHGCLWFRNRGDWTFDVQRIATFGGTYAAAVGDLNGDRHRDVVLVSMFNDWDDPRHASIIWLENDGKQNFRPWQIDEKPTHLVTVDCGDLNGDGRDDIVAGGLHLTSPFDRLGRMTSWSPTTKGTP
ncbi:FG-GAP repeat protein [Caulifigura coniformis]|uniref:FG-GAP repeat protein n=1 Tax=Caulifigura coniformis TaxID=2527983 RepID=A0A517SJI3_9PLAN|nr:VCBS repeat-containing protein [Caulifigura coniformis]QDT56285.1 FG-GAP repeat protein [Caulifigura coniformis]